MHGTFKTRLRFHVREVSLRQLAGLWSTVMACLAEVRSCAATFECRGKCTKHTYVYGDADELACAELDVKPDELRLCDIGVRSPDTTVHIGSQFHVGPWHFLIAQPKWLTVNISGSNERHVVKLRAAIERWGERNLETSRRWLWLRAGVLAAGIGVAGVIAVISDLGAVVAIAVALFWFAAFKCAELLQWFIPELHRRTLELRVVSGPRGDGGGRGRHAPAAFEPDTATRAGMDIDTSALREDS